MQAKKCPKTDLHLVLLIFSLHQEKWWTSLRLAADEEEGAKLWWAALQPGVWFGDALRNRPVAVTAGSGMCKTTFMHAGD